MGLDMYLYASKYESKSQWRNNKEEVKGFYPEDLEDLQTDIFERNFVSKDTHYQIGYWRKFNALHHYIVENFADGEDDCRRIYLSPSDIGHILDTLRKARDNKERVGEILPTQSGFFFGTTDYDEWYWRDVEYAIRLFEEVVKIQDEYEIYYQASW
jgi:hypothetical protein